MGLIMKNGIAYAGSPSNVYDDTEIRESVDKKLDKDGDASLLSYVSPDFSSFQRSEQGLAMGDYERLGFLLEREDFLSNAEDNLGAILFIKEMNGIIYIGGVGGFGTLSKDMTTYIPILYTQDYGTQLQILDVEITKTRMGDIVYAMTAENGPPYCYNPTEGTLTPINYAPDLSSFRPVKIIKDATRGENQARLYFVQYESPACVGYCEGEPTYIMSDVNFTNSFSTHSLTDFIAFEEEGSMRMFCCSNSDIFFKINRDQWIPLSDYVTYPWSDWGNTTIYKLYYDKKIDDCNVFAFIYGTEYGEATIATIPYTMYAEASGYKLIGDMTRINLNQSTLLFGKEGSLFAITGNSLFCIYDKMINGYEFYAREMGLMEYYSSDVNQSVRHCPRVIFNSTNQNYYFTRTEDRLPGLSYEKEDRTLSYGLGKVDEAVSSVNLMGYDIQNLYAQIEELREILYNNGLM